MQLERFKKRENVRRSGKVLCNGNRHKTSYYATKFQFWVKLFYGSPYTYYYLCQQDTTTPLLLFATEGLRKQQLLYFYAPKICPVAKMGML